MTVLQSVLTWLSTDSSLHFTIRGGSGAGAPQQNRQGDNGQVRPDKLGFSGLVSLIAQRRILYKESNSMTVLLNGFWTVDGQLSLFTYSHLDLCFFDSF